MIPIGSLAPDFTLSDQHGEELTLSEIVEEGPVTLVFFPLAFSGICTSELCQLRDNFSLFNANGVRLLAISVDSVWTLRAWATREQYNFSLLSDFWPHGKVAQDYGVFNDTRGIAGRLTVVVDRDQRVVASFRAATGEARDLNDYRAAISAVSVE